VCPGFTFIYDAGDLPCRFFLFVDTSWVSSHMP
jgi:hypothetical protein